MHLYSCDLFSCWSQTFPDKTKLKGKIHPFSWIAVTFEPMRDCVTIKNLEYPISVQPSFFYDWKLNSLQFALGGPVKQWKEEDNLVN